LSTAKFFPKTQCPEQRVECFSNRFKRSP